MNNWQPIQDAGCGSVHSNSQPVDRGRVPKSFLRFITAPVASLLVLALVLASTKPAVAKYTDESGSLPGTSTSTAAIVGAAAGGAALIALLIYMKHHKKHSIEARFSTEPVKVTDYTPGQAKDVPATFTNNSHVAARVTEVSVEDSRGALKLTHALTLPAVLAPGEKLDIPVTLSTNKTKGEGRVRLVVSGQDEHKSSVLFIKIHYRHA